MAILTQTVQQLYDCDRTEPERSSGAQRVSVLYTERKVDLFVFKISSSETQKIFVRSTFKSTARCAIIAK
jgi:hypothetical protein